MVMPIWIIATAAAGLPGLVVRRGRMLYLSALRGAQVIVSPPPSASPFRPRLIAALLASLLGTLAAPAAPLAAAERDPAALLDRLDSAWKLRDEAAWLGAWRMNNDEQRVEERDYVRRALGRARSRGWRSSGRRRSSAARSRSRPRSSRSRSRADASSRRSSRSSRGPDGWAVTGRNVVSQIDGLVHLTLGSPGLSGRRAQPAPARFRDPLSPRNAVPASSHAGTDRSRLHRRRHGALHARAARRRRSSCGSSPAARSSSRP